MKGRELPVVRLSAKIFHDSRREGGVQASLTAEEKELSVIIGLLTEEYTFGIRNRNSRESQALIDRYQNALGAAADLKSKKSKHVAIISLTKGYSGKKEYALEEVKALHLAMIAREDEARVDAAFCVELKLLAVAYHGYIQADEESKQSSLTGGLFNWRSNVPVWQVKQAFLEQLLADYNKVENLGRRLGEVLAELVARTDKATYAIVVSGVLRSKASTLLTKIAESVSTPSARNVR